MIRLARVHSASERASESTTLLEEIIDKPTAKFPAWSTYDVDGFLIVPLLRLMLVMTRRSEKRNKARSFRVPWFDAMVTKS